MTGRPRGATPGRLLGGLVGLAVLVVMVMSGCASGGDDTAADGPEALRSQTAPSDASPSQRSPSEASAEQPPPGADTTPTTFGGITTTTVFEVVAPDCDPVALSVASLAAINPLYSTVDSYGCDSTHAWAWMSTGGDNPDQLLSVLFVASGSLWRAMDTVAACTTTSGSAVAPDLLASGCAHL